MPAAEPSPQLLAGVRVVELADFVAGPFAAKLLADAGAEVIKIEPPEGDSARRAGPFLHDEPHRETSATFLQHNTNKRGLRLDVRTRAGRRLLRGLLAEADVFVYDLRPGEQAALDLRAAELSAAFPRLIVASVTPYGLSGPAADLPSAPLTRAHSAGTAVTLRRGLSNEGGPPIATGGNVNEADGGMALAVATIAALMARGDGGDGQIVEVSIQEALMSLDRVDLSMSYNDPQAADRMPRRSGRSAFGGRMECKDGYVIVVTPQAHQWEGLIKAMGSPGWAYNEDGSLRDRTSLGEEEDAWIDAWAKSHTREEIYRIAQAESAPVGPVFYPSEILASEQERERAFFEPIAHPRAGEAPYPTFPAHFRGASVASRRPAPLLGADTAAVLAECLPNGWTPAQARRAGIA